MPKPLSKMQSVTVALAVVGAVLITARSAQATIIFTPEFLPILGGSNITGSAQTGTTVTGEAGCFVCNPPGIPVEVDFSSVTGETLSTPGGGLSIGTPAPFGDLTSINATVPRALFSAYQFNLFFLGGAAPPPGPEGNATVVVTDNAGDVSNYVLSRQPSASTFLTITTTDDELISNVEVRAPGGFRLITDQFIIVQCIPGREDCILPPPPPVQAPEPATITMLGSALLGFVWAMRHRKRRESAAIPPLV